MITDERLQEIKVETMQAKRDFIHGIPPRYTLIDNAQELITALEAAQQKGKDDLSELNRVYTENADFCAQLAKAQAEVEKLKYALKSPETADCPYCGKHPRHVGTFQPPPA